MLTVALGLGCNIYFCLFYGAWLACGFTLPSACGLDTGVGFLQGCRDESNTVCAAHPLIFPNVLTSETLAFCPQRDAFDVSTTMRAGVFLQLQLVFIIEDSASVKGVLSFHSSELWGNTENKRHVALIMRTGWNAQTGIYCWSSHGSKQL